MEEPKNMVSFTPYKLVRLKKAYEQCEPHKTFIFEGNEYLKEYAGYLIQYLDSVFGTKMGHQRKNVPL